MANIKIIAKIYCDGARTVWYRNLSINIATAGKVSSSIVDTWTGVFDRPL